MSRLFFFIMLVFLTACGSRSLDDFREEGEGITRSLIKELESIRNRQELLQAAPRLQKRFDSLVDVMIRSKEYKEKYSKIDLLDLPKKDHELSDQLRVELNRIYNMEGGRKIIEKCQEVSLHRLDAFEKKLAKQRI